MEDRTEQNIRRSIAKLSKTARTRNEPILAQKKKDFQAKTWIQDSPAGRSYVILLPTQGCSWALSEHGGCTICGYLEDTSKGAAIIHSTQMHFEQAISSIPLPPPETIKIFNSGSFFDEKEIPIWLQREILTKIEETLGIEHLIVETRPEFVNNEVLTAIKQLMPTKSVTVALGLETSNDMVRRDCINKGFTRIEIERAVKLISEYGLKAKAYILLKPPFLTEAEAISDCVSSALYAERIGVDEVSINPVNVQRNTLLEKLWKRKSYRPPWLWSLLWAIQEINNQTGEIEVLCEPVGGGTPRGVHNCRKCDKKILAKMRKRATKDWHDLGPFDCTCLELWQAIIEDESHSYALKSLPTKP
ncbi:MAG: archaeosine biosynthesis radical SAM protein RaSEA [Candidatus Heimdallarchaeota archaeon]